MSSILETCKVGLRTDLRPRHQDADGIDMIEVLQTGKQWAVQGWSVRTLDESGSSKTSGERTASSDWRRLIEQGELENLGADEQVVPAFGDQTVCWGERTSSNVGPARNRSNLRSWNKRRSWRVKPFRSNWPGPGDYKPSRRGSALQSDPADQAQYP